MKEKDCEDCNGEGRSYVDTSGSCSVYPVGECCGGCGHYETCETCGGAGLVEDEEE